MKDQGNYGSCWAFSAAAAIDGFYNVTKNASVNNQLIVKEYTQKDVTEDIPKKQETNLHIHTLVHKDHANLQEVPPDLQVFQRLEQHQLPSKLPSKHIQLKFVSMKLIGPNIKVEHSEIEQQTSIMQSQELDLMLQVNGSLKTNQKLMDSFIGIIRNISLAAGNTCGVLNNHNQAI